tara:strand:+ start:2212 stop:4266 length:2055 start_codon:yes stop_codon:yes gene_type:complete
MGLFADTFKGMRFPGTGGGAGFQNLRTPGDMFSTDLADFSNRQPGEIDYSRLVGDGSGSSMVEAVIRYAERTFPEAALQVRRPVQGEAPEIVPGHALLDLIDTPNPFYSGELLWMPTVASWLLDGNAYWIKNRFETGNAVAELWYVPHTMIQPMWPKDGSAFISGYEYKVDNKTIVLPPEDVVHFRWGLDPSNTRKGSSPLSKVLREIYTDEEAARFSATMLKNLGVPGLVVSPAGDAKPDSQTTEDTKKKFEERFGGSNRGRTLVMKGPTKVEVLGFSPEAMNLRDLRKIPEERVTAVFGLPAIVAGLGAGLDRSTFANFAEAREAAVESLMVPLWRLMSAELRRQLLPEFETSPNGWKVNFDTSDVRVLQEDETRRSERIVSEVKGGIRKVNDAQRTLGIVSDDSQDVYLRPLATIEVRPDEERERAEPVLNALKALGVAEGKATSQQRDIVQALLVLRERLQPRGQKLIADVFDGLANEAADEIDDVLLSDRGNSYATKIDSDPLPGDAEERISQGLRAVFEIAARASWAMTGDALDAPALAWDITLPEVERALSRSGEHVRNVTDGTRKALAKYLEGNIARVGTDGFDREDLKRGIREIVSESYHGRSEAIARTELRRGSNAGTMARYESVGVQSVQAVDGDQDEPCELRNGRLFTVAEAQVEDDREHPNGTLSFIPIIE